MSKVFSDHSSSSSSSTSSFALPVDGFPLTETSSVSNISVAPPVERKQICYKSDIEEQTKPAKFRSTSTVKTWHLMQMT